MFVRKPLGFDVSRFLFDRWRITPRVSAFARATAGTNWPNVPRDGVAPRWAVKMAAVTTRPVLPVTRSAPTEPGMLRPDVPVTSLSTASARGARSIAVDAVELTLGAEP